MLLSVLCLLQTGDKEHVNDSETYIRVMTTVQLMCLNDHYDSRKYTVNNKKGGSTFAIITLENLDGF